MLGSSSPLAADQHEAGVRRRPQGTAALPPVPPRPLAPLSAEVAAAERMHPWSLAFACPHLEAQFAAHYARTMWRTDLASVFLHAMFYGLLLFTPGVCCPAGRTHTGRNESGCGRIAGHPDCHSSVLFHLLSLLRPTGLHVVEAAAHNHPARHNIPRLAAHPAHPAAALLVRPLLAAAQLMPRCAMLCVPAGAAPSAVQDRSVHACAAVQHLVAAVGLLHQLLAACCTAAMPMPSRCISQSLPHLHACTALPHLHLQASAVP